MRSKQTGGLWKSLVETAGPVLERLFSLTSGSTWFRFLLIPLMALLLWAVSMPISVAVSSVVEFLVNDAPGKLEHFTQAVKILLFGLSPPLFPSTPLPATPPPLPDFYTQLSNGLSEVNKDPLQLIILVAASMWAAYRLMIHFVLYLYEIEDFHQAARIVESAFLPFKRRKAVIQNGIEIASQEISVQEMVGGRSAFTMDAYKGYAAVLERPGTFSRVVGPQDQFPVSLDSFTHLREVIDLRDQRLTISTAGHTQDGIPIQAQAWSFNCRLAGSKISNPQKHFLSCETTSVHNLVYQHWIGLDWKSRSKRQIALQDLVGAVLRDFIAGRRLVEFLPDLELLNQAATSDQPQHRLIEQFVEYFAGSSGEHGLQLVWTGRGGWQLGPGVELGPILENGREAYDNWLKNRPEVLAGDGAQKRHEEARRLGHHVIGLYDDMLITKQPEDQIMTALARHYLDRLQETIRMVEGRGEKPTQEWLQAARHLERLV